jgi:hypothetical protein
LVKGDRCACITQPRRQSRGVSALRCRAKEIRSFVEMTGIPFLPMSMAKGLLPDDHPQSAAAARSYAILQRQRASQSCAGAAPFVAAVWRTPPFRAACPWSASYHRIAGECPAPPGDPRQGCRLCAGGKWDA